MPVLVFDLVVCAACNYAAPVMCLFLDEPSHHVRYTGTSIRQAASPGYGSICCWISSQPQCLYRTLWQECCVLLYILFLLLFSGPFYTKNSQMTFGALYCNYAYACMITEKLLATCSPSMYTPPRDVCSQWEEETKPL